ncbi:uncharacterized protein B0T15DRAFT_516806 [Chaetomium strumarium]|uniref:Zonadhesin n=1 Tax=Chaetomium strumarium TaxID=1170767 RepID=A0AAJ0H138_9PEZI|nr:hypothetical protein B0T15DRAFT_516806 [Chaetomium strumarium]
MQQPFIYRPVERGPYEYSIQATEDRYERPVDDAVYGPSTPVWRSGSTPNYKPKALRWPFISTVIAMLLVAIVLVIVAVKQMPDSDTDVKILGLHPNASQPVRFARDVPSNTSVSATYELTTDAPTLSNPATVITTPSQTPKTSVTSSEEDNSVLAQGVTTTPSQQGTATTAAASTSTQPPAETIAYSSSLASSGPASSSTPSSSNPASSSGPASSTSPVSSSDPPSSSRPTSSIPSSAENRETTTTSNLSSGTVSNNDLNLLGATTDSFSNTLVMSTTTTASLPSGAQLMPVSVSVSRFTTNITVPVTTSTYTTVVTTTETIQFSSDITQESTFVSTVTNVDTTTFLSYFTVTGTEDNTPTKTLWTTMTNTGLTTFTATVTTPVVGTTVVTASRTITATSTITGVVIPSTGEVTITYYATVFPPNTPPTVAQPPPQPITVTDVQVVDGTTIAVVHTQAPVVVAVPSDEVKTQVVGQQVSTGVVRVPGSVVTSVVVITPSAGRQGEVVTNLGGTPVTVIDSPGPVTLVTAVDGVQCTIVETRPPQTVIRMEGGVLTTITAGQPVTQSVVNNVGGTPVTQVVVTTPAGPPYQPISYTVVRDAGGGTLVTEVIVTTPAGPPGQPITYTAVDVVGGTPVTQLVVTTLDLEGAAVLPVSYTITTNVGGTPTVITLTPSPTTIVETVNGTPVTRVTTPPVTSFTTTVGGTLATQILVTTPTGTEPITLTLVSTPGDSLSTFTTTIPPTTFLTTISGSLRTITSTPSPSTSFSTRQRSTRTFTSTSTPTTATAIASATATNPPPGPSVVPSSTRVYRWTEADIFVGTFLPTLLGVALVIPLRIIDLNAKLYQPFQTLARPGGGFGAETLLLQYTGLTSGFLTPLVVTTLLRPGHAPVPFLTTLMVLCASFMVPLATEAVGLKLHGECYLNTASPGCGPALGVSPVPAYALVGLMGAVVVMLVLVLACLGRWVTGLHANPWNLAGAASLVAGNEQLHVGQGSEAAMRRAMADKRYGLGYFTNAAGREDYGIVLLDEAGRGLREDRRRGDGETDDMLGGGGDDDDDPAAMVAKWGGDGGLSRGCSHQQELPFMTLRYPWRIAFALFQLAVLIFVIYYHAYYRGGIRDNGRLWLFLNANTFGVRFVSAVIGVIIAFGWQSFFLSVSTMTPFLLLSRSTQPPTTSSSSILLTPSTNPFSGFYSALRHRQPFLLAVSLAAILSEFLPVVLSNVPFHLAQTRTAATVCAVLSCVSLALMLAVLLAGGSLFLVRCPPMPVDPRCIAGMLWYVSRSSARMLDDFEGVARLEGGVMMMRGRGG